MVLERRPLLGFVCSDVDPTDGKGVFEYCNGIFSDGVQYGDFQFESMHDYLSRSCKSP